MEYVLRSELLNELNILKSALKDAETNGEISHEQRCKVMNCVGQMKSILYSDLVFKSIYTKQKPIILVIR